MKIIVTGSLGHISQPLTQQLVQKGHTVTVISSNPEKQNPIQELGATAAIGSLEDVNFLTAIFTGADAVYTMVPPNNYFDHSLDLIAYYCRLGQNYAQAIGQSGVKRVVNLSSIGAHLEKGNGILVGANKVEHILNGLPSHIAITHLRPTSFYYNLYGYADMIKNQGLIAANYGAEDVVPWVAPQDIADAIAQELDKPFTGRKVRYVASEELSCAETARILGQAIGKPDLPWHIITNEQMQSGLIAAGMNPKIAAGLVEMYAGLHSGLLAQDYYANRPTVIGRVKLREFAKEFASVYGQNS
ncbi:NAD(P)H-binding protein [Rhodocytophaga aerolata]|uniref:NAD(P)H-binding protein n=1 Tax=Rhodocytophaga aerolata TaxID=455078 RepID=A0ABT8RCA2_9BACT|nr:NAD(P)H-binding protein [Rhodocytophaga aerolata]MDO1449729.1 NAD(P)H-binding protein [Rhodocytophaga aerolata]